MKYRHDQRWFIGLREAENVVMSGQLHAHSRVKLIVRTEDPLAMSKFGGDGFDLLDVGPTLLWTPLAKCITRNLTQIVGCAPAEDIGLSLQGNVTRWPFGAALLQRSR